MVDTKGVRDDRIPKDHYAIQDVPPPANTDHVKRKFPDIPYADLSPAQKLDIYLPDEGAGPFPVIISFHGGAFMGCDMVQLDLLEGAGHGDPLFESPDNVRKVLDFLDEYLK